MFFQIYGDLNLCSQPHASCSDVDSGLHEKEAAGTVKPVHQSPQVEGNTAIQSCCEEVVLQNKCYTHPAQSATSVITESEHHPFSQTTNICFDVINLTSLEIFAAASQGQTGRETNIPVLWEATSPAPSQKESGQSASTCFMTPNKRIEGIALNPFTQEESVLVDGKR